MGTEEKIKKMSTVLTGSYAQRYLMSNATQIRDTGTHTAVSNPATIFQVNTKDFPGRKTVLVNNTHDQAVSFMLRVLDYKDDGTLGLTSLNFSLFAANLSVPASSTKAFDITDETSLQAITRGLDLAVTCAVAPTLGDVSIVVVSSK